MSCYSSSELFRAHRCERLSQTFSGLRLQSNAVALAAAKKLRHIRMQNEPILLPCPKRGARLIPQSLP